MSSRLKAILIDTSGSVLEYRLKEIKALARAYNSGLHFTGNRASDLELTRETFAEHGILLFTWREAKEARGREFLVQKLRFAIKQAKTSVIGKLVVEQVRAELSGTKKKQPLSTWIEEQQVGRLEAMRAALYQVDPEIELDRGDMEPDVD